VVSGMQAEPFTKEDFKQRMDSAISYNRQEAVQRIGYDEFGQPTQDANRIMENLNRLDELKEKAIKEYNLFFDAYYSRDSNKVHKQTQKLKVIFDEMNPLMVTVVRFHEIYANIYYWSLQLDYYIEKGIVIPGKEVNGSVKPKIINAVKEKTAFDNEISDIKPEEKKPEPESNFFVFLVAGVLFFAVIVVVFLIRKK
jgi:hypothetical protein